MEESLKEELHSISGLYNNVFPLDAPENYPTPYLVYLSSEGVNVKSLNGFLSSKSVEVELRIVCDTYSRMKEINSEVVQRLQSFLRREIGVTDPVFVRDILIEEPVELWDKQVGKYRGIIEFTINI